MPKMIKIRKNQLFLKLHQELAIKVEKRAQKNSKVVSTGLNLPAIPRKEPSTIKVQQL